MFVFQPLAVTFTDRQGVVKIDSHFALKIVVNYRTYVAKSDRGLMLV